MMNIYMFLFTGIMTSFCDKVRYLHRKEIDRYLPTFSICMTLSLGVSTFLKLYPLKKF